MIQLVPHGEQSLILSGRSWTVSFNNRMENVNAQYWVKVGISGFKPSGKC